MASQKNRVSGVTRGIGGLSVVVTDLTVPDERVKMQQRRRVAA